LRVVDQRVDAPEPFDRSRDQVVDLAMLLDVAHDADVFDADRVELGAGFGDQLRFPVGDDDARATLAEM
jgi:hypothetical protein